MDKAVALRYGSDLPGPIILAAGRGKIAERITALAERHGIACVGRPELADVLIDLAPGELLPERLYEVVAELLAFLQLQTLHDDQDS